MAFSEYGKYDAMGLAELVRKKKITAAELLDEAIARTSAVDPQINAVVVKHYDYAERQIKKGLPEGPFMGVPFLLKESSFSRARARLRAQAFTKTRSPTIPARWFSASSMPA